jgi:hypothetical protein
MALTLLLAMLSGQAQVLVTNPKANPVNVTIPAGSVVSENLTQVNSQPVNVGTGTAGTGTQRVAVASDSSLTCNAGTNLNTSLLSTAANQTTLGNQTTKINDGTNTAAVKAASTAAAATDPALVCSLSPNSPTPLSADVVGASGALNALNAAVQVVLAGTQSASVTISSGGTLNGTIVPECSADGATTWDLGYFLLPPLEAWTTSQTSASFSNVRLEVICPGGYSHARVRVSSFTSGTSTAQMRATSAARPFESPALSNIGTATQPQSGIQIGGWDGANYRMAAVLNTIFALKTDMSSVAGTATSTAAAGVQKVGIAGSTGTTFETTAGVLDTNLKNVANAAVSTAASGVQKVGVVGNAGAAFDAANNAAAPANVMVHGYEAATQGTTQPTAATAGNVRRVVMSTDGAQYVRNGGPVAWSAFVEAVTVMTQVRAAPAAGLRAYVTSITCSNEAATVQSVDVTFGTGANCATGTTALTHKHQMGTVATTTSPFLVSVQYHNPLVPTAANAICVRPSAATAFGCTVTGYDAP